MSSTIIGMSDATSFIAKEAEAAEKSYLECCSDASWSFRKAWEARWPSGEHLDNWILFALFLLIRPFFVCLFFLSFFLSLMTTYLLVLGFPLCILVVLYKLEISARGNSRKFTSLTMSWPNSIVMMLEVDIFCVDARMTPGGGKAAALWERHPCWINYRLVVT